MTSSMPGVFIDRALDEQLGRDSFVVVPFLDPDEIESLKADYWRLCGEGATGMHITFMGEDRVTVRQMSDALTPVWKRHFGELFQGHRPVASSFLVKHPGEDSALFLHRDLPVHDERDRRCFTVWVPLVDVSAELENGALDIVGKTVEFEKVAMGPSTPLLHEPYHYYLERHQVTVDVPAGSAMIFDARMLHASAPNRSQEIRYAFACLLAEVSEPLVTVFATGRRHRVLYEVDEDFFIDQHPVDIQNHGMPPGYEVYDEYDERSELPRERVQEIFGDEDLPPWIVFIPYDMRVGDWEPRETIPEGERFEIRHDHDLPIGAADVGDAPASILGADVTSIEGQAGARDLWLDGQEVGAVPPAIAPRPEILDDDGAGDRTLVVLDPLTRLRFTVADHAHGPLGFGVVECPAVRSGVRSTGFGSTLDLGHRYLLDAASEVTIWNDGPGPAVLVFERGPAPELDAPPAPVAADVPAPGTIGYPSFPVRVFRTLRRRARDLTQRS